jgi:hypothetical protein
VLGGELIFSLDRATSRESNHLRREIAKTRDDRLAHDLGHAIAISVSFWYLARALC